MLLFVCSETVEWNPVKLETSCTVILPHMVRFLWYTTIANCAHMHPILICAKYVLILTVTKNAFKTIFRIPTFLTVGRWRDTLNASDKSSARIREIYRQHDSNPNLIRFHWIGVFIVLQLCKMPHSHNRKLHFAVMADVKRSLPISSLGQCDQMARLFLNSWSLKRLQIGPIA